MPIDFFVQEEEAPSLEFLPDYLEENPKANGQTWDVFAFKKAKSGKGYMLYTSHFICWFYKKEQTMQQVLEALDFYCKTGSGFQFVVKVDTSIKRKFHLGIDTDREVRYIPLENSSYRLENTKGMADTKTDKKEQNPFLINKIKPSLQTPPTDQLISGDLPPLSIPQGGKGRSRSK